jgi:hypothetical protein
MTVDRAWASIADRISDRQVLALEQSAIRIPSTTFAASVPSRRPGAPCRPRRRRAMVQGRWAPAEGASRG